MKRLIAYFLQGLLLVAPLVVTGYIVYKVFIAADGLLSKYIEKYLGYNLPGMGILLIFISLVLLGIAGETIFARPIKRIINRILDKLPFLKLIYSSVNDLFSAIVGKERKFHNPVMVLIDKQNGIWKIGFITQNKPVELESEELITVYCPFSYALSGEIYFVPASSIRQVSMPPTEAMKFIISGGVSGKGVSLTKKIEQK